MGIRNFEPMSFLITLKEITFFFYRSTRLDIIINRNECYIVFKFDFILLSLFIHRFVFSSWCTFQTFIQWFTKSNYFVKLVESYCSLKYNTFNNNELSITRTCSCGFWNCSCSQDSDSVEMNDCFSGSKTRLACIGLFFRGWHDSAKNAWSFLYN